VPSLEDLVMAAQRGDRLAFTELARHEGDRAYRLAYAITGSRSDAEDIVQDSLFQAWLALPRLRDPGRWSAWFRRLLVNASRDRARRLIRLAEVPIDGRVRPLEEGGGPPSWASTDDRDEIRGAIDRLAADDRLIIALRYGADLEVPDIAEALAIPLGTAKSRLHRAVGRLRAILAAERERELEA
jgi:RNA polymerase sigma-70 factor (ECF subfamily)